MDSVDSLDIVHDTLDKVQGVQADWTMSMDKSTESIDWLDIVQGLTGLCPVWFGISIDGHYKNCMSWNIYDMHCELDVCIHFGQTAIILY